MGEITAPKQVKAIFGLIYQDPAIGEEGKKKIESQFGAIDYCSEAYPFSETKYYNQEMGDDLIRQYLSLENLIYPDELISLKHFSNLWEEQFTENGNRKINIDPGYITGHSLILASTKNFKQRIYVGRGIYAEVTLLYHNKDFHKLDWSYSDYYNHKDDLLNIRKKYRKQILAHEEPS